mmetsp:Transcript_8349/g.14306  ORF Transcript_8349/g.14306 Transcript_8349/m.14306 type:complete len:91 (-) Transcript_8349:2862-3134(-)
MSPLNAELHEHENANNTFLPINIAHPSQPAPDEGNRFAKVTDQRENKLWINSKMSKPTNLQHKAKHQYPAIAGQTADRQSLNFIPFMGSD